MTDEWFFSPFYVPSTNMEDTGFMTYTAASQQGAINTFWLHFLGEVLLSSLVLSSHLKPQTQKQWLTATTDAWLVEHMYWRDLDSTVPSPPITTGQTLAPNAEEDSVTICDILTSFLDGRRKWGTLLTVYDDNEKLLTGRTSRNKSPGGPCNWDSLHSTAV